MSRGLIVCERDAGKNVTSLTTAADIALDSDKRTVEGFGSVYDYPYEVTEHGRTFLETMRFGVFGESLKEMRPVSQYMHGRDSAVGSAPILALEVVREQKSGLYFRGTLLPGVPELIVSGLRAGEITGASVKFGPTLDRWSSDKTKRDVLRAHLYEVGVVVHQANPAALVKLRHHRINGDKPVPLSGKAQRHLDVWRLGGCTWAEIPGAVRSELLRERPNRVDTLRMLERSGMLKPLALAVNRPREKRS